MDIIKADIELERTIYLGQDKKRADIAIFESGSTHKSNEDIQLIIESKRDNIKPNHRDQGIGQLLSYLAATPNAEYGMWVGSEVRAFGKTTHKGKITFGEVLDIPSFGKDIGAPTSFQALVPATDVLKDVFKRCHNHISNQGGGKEFAFHEFLKVTFCKVYDERFSKTPKFYISPAEQKTNAGKSTVHDRISDLFNDVCGHYGYIFGPDDTLKLNSIVIAYISAEMQKYSLLDTDFDYKGQAYVEIVGANSREIAENFSHHGISVLSL